MALTDAQNNYVQSLYDYNTSRTSLETAIGVPMQFPAKVTVDGQAAAETAAASEAAPADDAPVVSNVPVKK